jgi:hypothetical protein
LEGNGYGVIGIVFRHLSWGLSKITINLSYESRYPGLDSNRIPAAYKSSALPLHQSAQLILLFFQMLGLICGATAYFPYFEKETQ